MIKYKNIKNNQDLPAQAGQVMLLAVLIIGTSMLAMTSISGYLILQRIRSSSNIVDSTKAIFAADTGIEWEFFKCAKCNPNLVCDSACTALDFQKPLMRNKSAYFSSVVYDASSTPQSIKSVGQSVKAYRAFEIKF